MKIIIAVATYWPDSNGVQMVTQYHAERLAERGHEVTIVTSRRSGFSEKEFHNGVEIIRVDAWNYYYWHRGDKKAYQQLIKKLCREADALVAICLQSFAGDWILDIIDQIPCRKLLYMHGMPDFRIHIKDCHSIKNIAKVLFRNARWKYFYELNHENIIKFDAIIHLFYGDSSYRYFSKKGYEHNFVIENACEDEFFESNEKMDLGRPYFLYVANYCSRKNQEAALRAFYKTDNKDISLVFIGSTENRYCKKLQNMKGRLDKKYGNRDVRILWKIPRREIVKYTCGCFACILSSNYEYYPITIIEAMAAGKPFISRDVGIVKYLPGGILVKKEKEITKWMDRFSSNPEEAFSIGMTARQYAEKHMRIEKKVTCLESLLYAKQLEEYQEGG